MLDVFAEHHLHDSPSSAAGAVAPVPLSSAVAALLDAFALQVNAAASRGVFLSPFARLFLSIYVR